MGASKNNRSARAVLFMDFGKELEVGSMGLGNDKVGGSGAEIASGNKIGNSLGDDDLVFVCVVLLKG